MGIGKGNVRGFYYVATKEHPEAPDPIIERWVSCNRQTCPDCDKQCSRQLVEHSIISTFECVDGHRWSMIES